MDTSNPATDMFTYIHTYIYTRTLEQNKVGQAWRHTTWSGKASSRLSTFDLLYRWRQD